MFGRAQGNPAYRMPAQPRPFWSEQLVAAAQQQQQQTERRAAVAALMPRNAPPPLPPPLHPPPPQQQQFDGAEYIPSWYQMPWRQLQRQLPGAEPAGPSPTATAP